MSTIIYFLRHSEPTNKNNINNISNHDNAQVTNEKSFLSVSGEKRAEKLSKLEELSNIDSVYCSNYVRALETAKYILEDQNLKVTIDDRLDERRVGQDNSSIIKNWYVLQYKDENYKTVGGESQKEVRDRFNEAFEEIIKMNKGKRIAIF